MAYMGGANNVGTIFSVPVGGGTATTLFDFDYTHGQSPRGSLTLSGDGTTFYGMATNGGANNDGTVFSIPTSGGTPTTLCTFGGVSYPGPSAGAYPDGNLTLSGSTLYGMTNRGGSGAGGTVFELPTSGGTATTLFNFARPPYSPVGCWPTGSLTLSGSTLYGMTTNGGTIFSIPTSGGTPTVLFSFDGAYGLDPAGSLTISPDGLTLYGVAGGGVNGDGVIFSMPVTGGMPTVLFSFDGANGSGPVDGLTLSGSTLYGMTQFGGTNGAGTIFSLTLPTPTPEPSTLALLAAGAAGLLAYGWRRGRNAQVAHARAV
jgi:uncharacterized repeat protein (TIGR03803 family)